VPRAREARASRIIWISRRARRMGSLLGTRLWLRVTSSQTVNRMNSAAMMTAVISQVGEDRKTLPVWAVTATKIRSSKSSNQLTLGFSSARSSLALLTGESCHAGTRGVNLAQSLACTAIAARRPESMAPWIHRW
jgi:hypothetical protein